VDPRYSQCADLQRSVRFSSLWSYEACATPNQYSRQCGGYEYLPSNGNGFGTGAISSGGVLNLSPGPEGYDFNQIGGYPGLNSGYPGLSSGYSGVDSGYTGLNSGYTGLNTNSG